ncbi:MAG TPA: tail fiber protein [Rhizomicrobium sp.]|jgi:microcystin-dependent protein
MADPFVAQIELFAFNFAPKGWMFCNGQLLAISHYQALFSLIGNTFGGDGMTTFGLPDLRGRAPFGGTTELGAFIGQETEALLSANMPQHRHALFSTAANGNTEAPASDTFLAGTQGVGHALPGGTYDVDMFATNSASTTMSPYALAATGASQPHNNMMPYLTLNFCISMGGQYPPRG